MTRYHTKTISLAGRALHTSATSERSVAAVEDAVGCRLPAALRELLASDAWPAFLQQFSNSDQPIDVDRLLQSRWTGYDPIAGRVLPFMVENQGVCTWAVPLDAGADPEVLVEVDSGDPPTWQHAASSFSGWLRCQVLDHQLLERALFGAQAEPLGADVLAQLEERFDHGPRTFAWPARTVHRFSNGLGSLLLWAADDQCDWWIAPAEFEKAIEFLRALPLAAGFEGWLYELKPEGKKVLDSWRRPTSRCS